jgi:VWFA-related protein
VQAAQEADAVIYAIRYEDLRFSMSAGGFGAAGFRLDEGLANLNRLSTPTGGRVFDATRGKLQAAFDAIQAAFDAIGEEMRNQYGLGFAPAEAAGEGKFHRLEVRLRKSGLKAQARAGYYR